MRCYKCGSMLGNGDTCRACGADVKIYKRIIYLSNIHYNDALEKAQNHNLTGARESLVKSLKYNKRNVDSRNLLGLVYYGQGRVSEAIVEWIISSNIQPEGNLASGYVKYFQKHKDEMEEMNDVIRKYNQCLDFIGKGNEDLAFLHMKKLMSERPRLPECYQLMAIMCIRTHQLGAARKYLRVALSIDIGSRRTLNLVEIMDGGASDQAKKVDNFSNPISGVKKKHSLIYKDGNDIIIQPRSGSRLKATADVVTAGRVGGTLLIIVAIIWFLLIPAHTKNLNAKANETIREYNLQSQSDEEDMNNLQSELDAYKIKEEQDAAAAQASLGQVDSYEALLNYQRQYHNDTYDSVETITTLLQIDKSRLGETGQSVYDNLWNELAPIALEKLYEKGSNNEEWGEYEAAAGYFEQVLAIQADYNDSAALYHAGYCYEMAGNGMQARTYYEKMIAEHAGSGYAPQAQERLNGLNTGSTDQAAQ